MILSANTNMTVLLPKLKQLTRCCMTAAASATTFWVGSIFLQIMTRKSSHASRSVQRKSRKILMYSL